MPSGTKKFDLKHNNKFISLWKAVYKNKSEILLVCSRKGIGKTTEAIRLAMIEYQNNLLPSVIIKNSGIQAENFAEKIQNTLNDLNIGFSNNFKITKKGIFRYYQKKIKGKVDAKGIKPVINFLELSQAHNYQGTSFEKLALVIFDDIQNHIFSDSKNLDINISSLLSNVLRTRSVKKIIFLFNPINPNDPILNFFNLKKEFNNQKWGMINNYQIPSDKEKIKVAIFKALPSKDLLEDQKYSLSGKISGLTRYNRITNDNQFLIDQNNLPWINKLGNFKFIFNIENNKFGFWTYIKNETIICQISKKYNKNGLEIFFNFSDFSKNEYWENFDFFRNLKILFKNKLIEIDHYSIFLILQNYIK